MPFRDHMPPSARQPTIRDTLQDLFKDAARSHGRLHEPSLDIFARQIADAAFRQQFFMTGEAPAFLEALIRTSDKGEALCVEILKSPEGIAAIDEKHKSQFLTTRCLAPALRLLDHGKKAELLTIKTKHALGGGFGAQQELSLAANLAAWDTLELIDWLEKMEPEQKAMVLSTDQTTICLVQNARNPEQAARVNALLGFVPAERRGAILKQAKSRHVTLTFPAALPVQEPAHAPV